MNTTINLNENVDRPLMRQAQLVSNQHFELIVMPTEKCNFRCTYCYEDFAAGRMKPETIVGVKSLLSRRCSNLESLIISWFGGEPMVAKDTVLEISTHAMSLARQYPKLQYNGSMTTKHFNY